MHGIECVRAPTMFLTDNDLSYAGMLAIARCGHPNITKLHFRGTSLGSDAGQFVVELLNGYPNLRTLNLIDCFVDPLSTSMRGSHCVVYIHTQPSLTSLVPV